MKQRWASRWIMRRSWRGPPPAPSAAVFKQETGPPAARPVSLACPMKLLARLLLLLALGTPGFATEAAPRFDHLAFYVVDLKRSADFYRDLVGLKEIPEPFKDGKHAWFSLGTGMALHVISGAAAPLPKEKRNHLCLSVASMESFTTRLTKAGVVYEDLLGRKGAVTLRPDGVHQIYFQDPDGNWIEINNAKP